MRNSETGNDILPYKSLHIYVSDIGQRLSFDPFREIVCADQKVLPVSCGLWEWTHYIQTPLCKRPWNKYWVEDSTWLVYVRCKSLTLITLLYIIMGFFLHVRPPILLSNGSVGQPPTSSVTPTNSFMQLF